MSVTNEYRYYNNGAYELAKVIRVENGVRQETKVNRSIFGPIPRSDLLNIIRSRYNNEEGDWQNRLTKILRDEDFYTNTIITSSGREVGMKISSYLTSGKFAWNAIKTTCYLGVATAIFFTPSIIKSRNKDSQNNSKEEKGKKISFSELVKSHTSYSSQKWWSIMNGDVTNSVIVDGVIGAGVGITLAWAGCRLYSQLMKTVGPLGFEEWRESKKVVFDKETTVPKNLLRDKFWFEEDGQEKYFCPITQYPIRVPCRTPDGHLFEESAIVSWIVSQLNQGLPTTNPLTRAHLTFEHLRVDQYLSDIIELRILFLEAFPECIDNVPE